MLYTSTMVIIGNSILVILDVYLTIMAFARLGFYGFYFLFGIPFLLGVFGIVASLIMSTGKDEMRNGETPDSKKKPRFLTYVFATFYPVACFLAPYLAYNTILFLLRITLFSL